jgi:class 3 adenylate cyclase
VRLPLSRLVLAALLLRTPIWLNDLHLRYRRAPDPADPQYRLIVVIDMAGSSRWDDRTQLYARMLLEEMVQTAFRTAGIAWHKIRAEDRGDGMILFIPATVPKAHLLGSAIPSLGKALYAHNLRSGRTPRIRVRVAVHAGEVLRGPHGCVGNDLNLTCRLVNSRPLYRTFEHCPNVELVIIISEPMYQAVVRHGHRGIAANRYTPVHVSVKETRAKAWLHIPEPS